MKKQWFCLILALLLLGSIFPAAAVTANAAEGQVTRAQWVQSLVKTFEMTVEEDNYPDNYFSDLTGEESYYRDILVAVEFGVIDVPAGLPFEPEAPATREFAAHTLNYCLGYQLEEGTTYTYSDAASVTYKDDVQVAVNRNWFTLSGGAFLPAQPITSAESSAMLADAAAILARAELDENFVSTYELKENIKVIPETTIVTKDASNLITITGCPEPIAQGDLFAVYLSGIPCAYRADSVTVDGLNTIIQGTQLTDEEAYDGIEAQGTVAATFTQFEALDDTEVIYVDDYTGIEYTDPVEAENAITARKLDASVEMPRKLVTKTSINLYNGVSFNVTVTIKNPKLTYKISIKEKLAYVKLEGESTTSYSATFSKAVSADKVEPKEVRLVNCTYPGIGGFTISLDAALAGTISANQTGYLVVGYEFTAKDGGRSLTDFEAKSFSMSMEVSGKVGLVARLGLTDLPVFKGYVFAEFGLTGSAKANLYDDGQTPKTCVHFKAHLYSNYGLEVKIKFLVFSRSHTLSKALINEDNSPLRIVHHYEDGVEVPGCTRTEASADNDYNYFTPGDSKNWSSGWSGGSGSKGYTKSGEPIEVYKYTLDKNGNATITSYTGNVRSIVIPEKLDGHTVVAIGEGVFKGRSELRSVRMADTITSIGRDAFRECRNLSSASLSKNLTGIGINAFYSCTALEEIEIPKTFGGVGRDGLNGPFAYSGLRVVTFEEGSTYVAEYLFSGANKLQKVTLPDTVTKIDSWAFSGCSKLSSVKLSKNLQIINPNAFRGCAALKKIEIPKSLTGAGRESIYGPFWLSGLEEVTFEDGCIYVPEYIFSGASELKTIHFADSITSIGQYAFCGCAAIQDIQFPISLTIIGNSAFSSCTGLTEVTIPDTVTKINARAFGDCNKLSKVTLSKNLEYLGYQSFNCDALEEIQIPKSLTTADTDYMYGPFGGSGLKTVTFEEGTTSVINYLFSRATKLENVTLLDSMTKIGQYAFYDCTAIKDIKLTNALTLIDYAAFSGCTGLTEVTIPDTVTKINEQAFGDCNNLSKVTLSKNLEYLGAQSFNCDALTEIQIPKSLTTADTDYMYGPFGGSGLKTVTFEEGTTSVINHLFSRATKLENVTLLDSMTRIGEYSFYQCDAMKQIRLPESLTSIGKSAFALSSALQEIVIPSKITNLNESTFSGCSALKSVTLPETMTSIGEQAFFGCLSLPEINLPDALTTLGKHAFYDNDALLTVTIPDQLKTLSESTFGDCKSLTSVQFGKAMTTIQWSVFQNCPALESVELGGNIATVGYDAFRNCDALTTVTVGGKVAELGSNCFRDCDALETVTIGNSVTKLGDSIFYHCDVLKNVSLGNGITVIPTSAFQNCALLEQIVIPYWVTEIKASAFNASPKLAKVVTRANLATIPTSAFSYPEVTVFYGAEGSYTQTFANKNGYQFVTNTTPADSVTLAQTELTIAKGSSKRLDLTVSPIDFGDSISFKSNKTDVATVSANGTIKAVAPGTATIKVTVGGVSASCKVTVTQAITKIALNTTKVSLEVPKTYQLKATITPADASNKTLTWTSSDESVATVDENGLVTAKGNGTAVITAEAQDGSGKSASCTFTITDPANIPVTSITLDKTSLALDALETYTLKATVKPTNAANQAITWASSDETVAKVDANGCITAIGKGKAEITATAADGYGAAAKCTVTVANNAHIVTDLSQFESPHNYPEKNTDIWVYTQKGTTELRVTFDERTNMEDGFDYLHIFDGQGNLVGTYTGTELAGQTITVPGDTVKIQISSDDSGTEWGFKVTDVSSGHTHSYGDWTVTREATCTEPGEQSRSCACGHTETQEIPQLPHTERTVSAVEPTCDTDGLTEGRQCSICGTFTVPQQTIPAKGHDYVNGTCTVCGEPDPNVPTEGAIVTRIAGDGRCQTAMAAAEELKKIRGVNRFQSIVVADGNNYPDALSGSYLAAVADAPILLIQANQKKVTQSVQDYILGNLTDDGIVYILGGTNSIPTDFENGIRNAGYAVERLAGADRYATSLMIVRKAIEINGYPPAELLVCTGTGYADSLSASATGRPVLLVNGSKTALTNSQKQFLLNEAGQPDIFVVGGSNSVSDAILAELGKYTYSGTAQRLAGDGREETSVAVANAFFPEAKFAVLANAGNYPDGLSGGPVAYAKQAPLLLIRAKRESHARDYVGDRIKNGYIMGGPNSVSDSSAKVIFGENAIIK